MLGHGHADHRGAAPGLGVPVFCHPDDRADAEGDGGAHYFDFSKLNPLGAARASRRCCACGTAARCRSPARSSEGDEVAGFRVVHIPGHAPGHDRAVARGRPRRADERLLLHVDPQTGGHGPARVPHAAFNFDTEQARESIRKLAALDPAAAWPGHADPLTGDVRGELENAAAAA